MKEANRIETSVYINGVTTTFGMPLNVETSTAAGELDHTEQLESSLFQAVEAQKKTIADLRADVERLTAQVEFRDGIIRGRDKKIEDQKAYITDLAERLLQAKRAVEIMRALNLLQDGGQFTHRLRPDGWGWDLDDGVYGKFFATIEQCLVDHGLLPAEPAKEE